MPRTSVVEAPGCPPLRALTFDVLGFVKVVEARGKQGIPTVVARWGDPDPSRSAVVASIADNKTNPLLAVGRKNGQVEILSPLNGDVQAEFRVSEAGPSGHVVDGDLLVGLHLFKGDRLGNFLSCTAKGNVSIRPIESGDASANWNACNGGKITFSSVHGTEAYALFGGKGVELNLWDLGRCTEASNGSKELKKMWTAKPPPHNNLGIFTPTWFTGGTFLSKEDHRKILAGTNNHQIRLYDIADGRRRPVISLDFRESPIKAVTGDPDGHTVYVGNASGDLASLDMRTGKLLGCFRGKCCGSIRSIARHPDFPLIASCGLDAYLRFWDTKTRQPLSAVFLKQHLTNVVVDANFTHEGKAILDSDVGTEALDVAQEDVAREEDEDFVEVLPSRRKRQGSEHDPTGKVNSKKTKKRVEVEEAKDPSPSKRRKDSSEHDPTRKTKSKKSKKLVHQDEDLSE